MSLAWESSEYRDSMRRTVERRRVRKSLIDTLVDPVDKDTPDGLQGNGDANGGDQ
jgi:hypothetical protein